MLFNSYTFLFIFLPIVLAGTHIAYQLGKSRLSTWWLLLASILFYGWWDVRYLALLGSSIFVNHFMARAIAKSPLPKKKTLLISGVAFNLGLIAWYKYAGFLAATITRLGDLTVPIPQIVLPLAISFFTFQQIAYLVDTSRGDVSPSPFGEYALFVTFFPQLIAGPIVHHGEMIPQFRRKTFGCLRADALAIGFTIFILGLFKKVVIADQMAVYATPVFDAAAAGSPVGTVEAWGAALAYTFQLYFDFSGYSDMAIGLGRMFGVRIAFNFNSPYKSLNIIEFWRRWHITLSRFLRDYLYIPLGGNRNGRFGRYRNLMITMLLGGLWHGAGWTYVLWGGLHGFYLVCNHSWRYLCGPAALRDNSFRPLRWLLTFLAVTIAWVVFRAADLTAAMGMLRAMAGLSDIFVGTRLIDDPEHLIIGSVLLVLWCVFAPNTQEIMRLESPESPAEDGSSTPSRMFWTTRLSWAVLIGSMALVAVSQFTRVSEFLYFQF